MKTDIFRASVSSEYDLPPCPVCGGKIYIEELCGFRVAHFCKGGHRTQVKTEYCKTPDEAVKKYLDGEIIVK